MNLVLRIFGFQSRMRPKTLCNKKGAIKITKKLNTILGLKFFNVGRLDSSRTLQIREELNMER